MLLGWKVSMCQEMPSEVFVRCDGIVDVIMRRAQVVVKEESRQIEGNVIALGADGAPESTFRADNCRG